MGNDITAVALPFLVGQAEEILFRLQGDAAARRWLTEAHLDPAAMERRLAAQLHHAWEVATLPRFLGARLKRISGDRGALLARAVAWRKSLRRALGAAERHDDLSAVAREGVDAVRRRIRDGRLGVPGWRDTLRLALAELARVPCDLGPLVRRAADAGRELLAALDHLDEERRATLRRRSEATEAARGLRAALRKLIRGVHADWKIAVEVSRGALSSLDLGMLRGARGTAAAKRARREAREEAEAAEVEVDAGEGEVEVEVEVELEEADADEVADADAADGGAAGAGGEADGCGDAQVPPNPAEAVAEGASPAPTGSGGRRRKRNRRARRSEARGAAPAGGAGAG